MRIAERHEREAAMVARQAKEGRVRQHVVLGIAVMFIAACSSNGGNAGQQAAGTTTTTTKPPPVVAPQGLDALLPTVADLNTIFGVADMMPSDPQHDFDTNTIRISNADCAGPVGPVAASVYNNSGDTGLSSVMIFENIDNGITVTSGAVSFPSADAAKAFLQDSATKWKACSGQTITDANALSEDQHALSGFSGTDTKIQLTVAPVQAATPAPPVAIGGGQEAQEVAPQACQRALSTFSNVVFDVDACGPHVTDQAGRVADLMAGKVAGPGS
jgi:serine/threonine kinase PknH